MWAQSYSKRDHGKVSIVPDDGRESLKILKAARIYGPSDDGASM